MSRSNLRRSAFTLVELLVVMGIIATLIAMLLPALGRARAQANQVACMSNLRQIGLGLVGYVNENKGYLPHGAANAGTSSWTAKIAPWTLNMPSSNYTSLQLYKVYMCPAQPDVANGYKVNPYLGVVGTGDAPDITQPYRIERFKKPAQKAFVVDALPKQNLIRSIWFQASQYDSAGLIDLRHPGKMANICFLDGHVVSYGCGPIPRVANITVGNQWLLYTSGVPDGL